MFKSAESPVHVVMSKYSCCSDVPFESLVRFLQKMSEVPAKKKDEHTRLFLEKCVPRPTPDVFQTFRLLLPLVSVPVFPQAESQNPPCYSSSEVEDTCGTSTIGVLS